MGDDARTRSNAPLWIIALLLAVLVVGTGIYLVHNHQVAAERDKYRDQADYYCALNGYQPSTPTFKNCVEDHIDALIGEAKNS